MEHTQVVNNNIHIHPLHAMLMECDHTLSRLVTMESREIQDMIELFVII